MADKKISELTSATSLDGTEQLVIVKSGENRKVSTNTIKDFSAITVNDFSTSNGNIQLFVVVPEAVMELADSGTSSDDCITAFGGEEALSDWVTQVVGGKEVRIETGNTVIRNTNVTYSTEEDGSQYISIDYVTDESLRSIVITVSADDEVSVSHITSTKITGYTSWVRGSLYLATTSTVDAALNYYLGGDDNITKLIECIDNLGTVMLNNAMENDIYVSPIEYVTYNWSATNRVVGFKIPLESANTIKEIVVDMTYTSALSVTSVTSSVLDSSVGIASTVISNLDTITNQNGMFSTTSSTTGTFPSEIDTDAKKKGSLVRVSNSEASDTEGFDIWMSTDTSMSNYVYYRRYSGTGVVTSWFRLLDNETPDVMHANTTPLTTTSTHLKSGTYAIDADTTIEGVSAGYGSMLVQMENYTNNTGVRTLTMITGDDAGKTFVSTVLTGTYGAFTGMVTLAQYNELVARVAALE